MYNLIAELYICWHITLQNCYFFVVVPLLYSCDEPLTDANVTFSSFLWSILICEQFTSIKTIDSIHERVKDTHNTQIFSLRIIIIIVIIMNRN